MGNFDEDIKRITDEVLSDGTVEEIIRANVVKGFDNAIANAFRWGDLERAIEERVKTVMVPFIETYDMDDYLVKLDNVLSEIVSKSCLVENKKMLESFKFMMEEPIEKEIKITHLFREYEKFVARAMETSGRNVDFDGDEPKYEAMTVHFEFEEEEKRSWSSFKYATIDFTVDDEEQEDNLNRTIRLLRWTSDKKNGWEIITDTNPNIYSLRYMDEFDLMLAKLQKADVRIIIDDDADEDYVYSDDKPEPTFE